MFVRTHIVQKGDTLWKIAKQYGIDFEELKRLNSHLANPDYIVPGMEIILPDDHSIRKPSQVQKELPEKAKTVEVPKKEKKAETPPKAKEIVLPEKKQPVEKEMKLPEIPPTPPVPQIVPIPQQVHPHEKTEFHLDFSPHLNIQRHMAQPQFMPIPQPVMPQPIFIEIPQQAPQAEKKEEEKEKVIEKEVEYIPVPQTHVEYVPVPQPIYIPCIPQQVHPCHCKPRRVEHCGCREPEHVHHHAQPYFAGPHMLPPCPDYSQMQYQMMPQGFGMPYGVLPTQELDYEHQQYAGALPQMDATIEEVQDDADWLYDSASEGEETKEQVTISEDYSQSQEQYQDYKGFEQATLPSYDYAQFPQGFFPMEQGYYPPANQYMPQPMYPHFEQGTHPYFQQYPAGMNPCAPQFKPWSY